MSGPMNSLATLPAFLAYFAAALGVLLMFLALYTSLTPHREWTLIRAGNTAAAVALGGTTLGFCLPLASVVAHSAGLGDMLVWALVAVAAQLLTLLALRLLLLGNLWTAIEHGDMAAGTTVAAGSLAVGLLNAACLTY